MRVEVCTCERTKPLALNERSLRVSAINEARNETNELNENKSFAAMRARTLEVVNDPIYVRIVRIRPLGHHGSLKQSN
jgi:hypothetical protein